MTNLQKIKTTNTLTAKENKIYQKTLTKFSDASIYELKDRIDKNRLFWVNWHSHFNSLDDDLRPFGRYFDYVFPSIILTTLTITAYAKQWAEANAVAATILTLFFIFSILLLLLCNYKSMNPHRSITWR